MAEIKKFTHRKPADPQSTRRKVRLEQGIYEDRYGRFAMVTVTGPDPEDPTRTKKFYKESPRQPVSTPMDTMRALVRETDELLRRQIDRQPAVAPPPPTQTLRHDVPLFLETFKGTRKQTASNEMRHWVRLFGDRERNSLLPVEIRRGLVTLEEDLSETTGKPLSPGMVKHLRNTFKQFYDVLNTKSGYNPVRDVAGPSVVYDDPRYVPAECVELLLAQIEDYRWTSRTGERGPLNLTKLRLQCILYAGLSHAMLARIEPRDLQHLDQTPPVLYLRARRKGKNARPRTVPVTAQAVVALRTLALHEGLGEFSRSSLAKTFALARTKALQLWKATYPGKPWPAPANVRAYDFRHTFATDVLIVTDGDRGAVMDLLGHGTLEQGERYTQAAASLQSGKAILKLTAMHQRRQPRIEETP